MIASEHEPVTIDQHGLIEALVQRRLAGEPVARLRGIQEFYGLRFDLGPETLVPRPDTELLVDLALAFLEPLSDPKMLDLGTGTGCIPIALLHENKSLTANAVDLSDCAVQVAIGNARLHNVSERVRFDCGSWFAPLAAEAKFDLITANPPYVATPVIAGLSAEVREHDPALALDGGEDGLAAYRAILADAGGHLKPAGRIMLEIGYDQAADVRLICRRFGLHRVEVHQDLAGRDRVIVARC